jgi:phosphoribosyl-AMP cyclohydrolase
MSRFFLRDPPRRFDMIMMQLNLKYDDRGLIPAIVQESAEAGGRVLMMAWMNEDSLRHSVESGYMHYWSRSRKKLWKKGESSGHSQKILRWFVDCDRDTLLFEVEQHGGACHTGFASCFYTELDKEGNDLPPQEEPLFNPDSVYKA